ncbi:DNA ligase [bacterium]|nr:DNA ligase [bacterium]
MNRGYLVTRFFIFFILVLVIQGGSPVFAQNVNLQKPMVYSKQTDITNWFMSEKLDGVRGYWDGANLMTRKGNVLNPPQWFLKNFPPFELDGELWSSRNSFEFIQSTVLTEKPSDSWKKITFNIFEVPNAKGDFPTRLQKATKWFEEHPNNHTRIIPQIVCGNDKHLQLFVDEIELRGGEGVIVKDPRLDYHAGRSPHILKIKKDNDMEGKVVAVNPGKGKLTGMMGSLTLALENGITFKLGTGFSEKTRKHPPQKETIVTFKYYGFSKNGVPKFASFMRIRKD